MFNAEQRAHMDFLGSLPPTEKCYCGWYTLAGVIKCPHCPPGLSLADRVARMCPHPQCRAAAPPNNLEAPPVHTIRCPTRSPPGHQSP